MTLLNLQRRMARAVMAPLSPTERMRTVAANGRSMRAIAASFIKPNDGLDSFERLEIYNRQYWFRILSGFAEDFPGLRAVLGERRFDALAKAYLTACPSRSFTLRNLGSRLEVWLRKHPSWAGTRRDLAMDMVRLEWADIEAFDGKAEPAIQPEDLRSVDVSKLRLRLQPHIRLLALRYPVDDLLLEAREDGDSEAASNAFSEARKRKRAIVAARLTPSPIFLVVHRLDLSVYFRRLECEEFLLLTALQDGRSIGRAIENAFRESSVPAAERASHVHRWFQTWTAFGWFCRPWQ